MLDERSFDLGRGEAVTRDIDHVVHAATDPVVAFVITSCTVTRELHVHVNKK